MLTQFKKSLDRYLTTEPEDAFTPYCEIGSGEEATISLVAAIIAESLEFEGEIVFNGL